MLYLQDGMTPLYIASKEGHIDVVQLLLQMFADVSISEKVEHSMRALYDPYLSLKCPMLYYYIVK